MFAIGIDTCDFWSEVPPQDFGKQVPVDGISTSSSSLNGRSQVVIKQTINWVSPQSEVLAIESRVITVHQGAVNSASLLTWACTLTPTEAKPQVELWGSQYFGLGMRMVESMDTGATFLTPGDEAGTTVRRIRDADSCHLVRACTRRPMANRSPSRCSMRPATRVIRPPGSR